MTYIATFYTHFFAIKFKNNFKDITDATLMPVPRSLSSSCGTCCKFNSNNFDISKINFNEVEDIFLEKDGKYVKIDELK